MRSSRTKSEILERLAAERARLQATIASIEPGAMVVPGVVGEWSVKDVLAHLADWEAHMLVWLAAGRDGVEVTGPEEGLTWSGMAAFNRRIHAAHRDQALADVLAYFRGEHERFMDMVQAMPEREMMARGLYSFTGREALYDWLVRYAEHDAWGTRRLGEWLAERGAGLAQA